METKNIPLDKTSVEKNYILIDFQCMYDFDVAAVRYLIAHSKNDNLLSSNISNVSTISGLRNLLLFRNTNNPLSVCISEEYMSSIDSLYKELIENYEKEILNECDANYLHTYINILLKTNNLVEVTVNCENELQLEIAKKSMMDNAKFAINERNLADYDTLYIKYVSDIIQYINIHKKKIYMINALYNFDQGMFKKEILLLINNNNISVIDQYKNLTVPAIYNLLIDLNNNKENDKDDKRNQNESSK